MPGSFIDTNVLVYLLSDDPAKADRAEAIVAVGGSISVQVLNELANVDGLVVDDRLTIADPFRETA